jgi:hypothetical protein
MSDRRAVRFALEAAYLGALAAALAFTSLSAPVIVGAMLLGWALVAGNEWAAARARPHYAAGLPPRWHVPAMTLPPAQPLEQVLPAYPEAQRDEAATWIASAALREELLGEWPVLVDPEDTQEAVPEDWIVPLPDLEPDPEPEPEPSELSSSSTNLVRESAPEPEPEPESVREPEPEPVLPAAPEPRLARYHVDPFAEPERRRFGRRAVLPALEVAARPAGTRPLPGAAREAER